MGLAKQRQDERWFYGGHSAASESYDLPGARRIYFFEIAAKQKFLIYAFLVFLGSRCGMSLILSVHSFWFYTTGAETTTV